VSALTLAAADLRPGMTLAEDMRDAGGAVLLVRGTALDEAAIRLACERGCERIAVEDNAAAQARLDALFRKCRGQPASEALLQGLRSYRNAEGAR
jgi:hypothetical protein